MQEITHAGNEMKSFVKNSLKKLNTKGLFGIM